MSFGSKKESKVKARIAPSVYGGIDNFNVGLDGFANAEAQRNRGKSVDMTSRLAEPFANTRDIANTGLQNNLRVLGQNPVQQLQDLQGGNNNFYNLQREMNDRYLQDQLANTRLKFARQGSQNSTAAGGFEGQVLNDATLRDLSTVNQALTTQNQLAATNAGVNNATLGQLASIQSIPLQAVQQNFLEAMRARDAMAQFNAQQQARADQINAQIEAANSRSSFWGSLAQLGGQLAGAALGSFGGPTGASIGSSIGGSIGGKLGGGGGGANFAAAGPFAGGSSFGGGGVPPEFPIRTMGGGWLQDPSGTAEGARRFLQSGIGL